jgi:ADP-ribose pyrophosphatase YjhB (NUDIX family)
MASDSPLHQVTTFITRGLPQPHGLLVLHHPASTTALPSGLVNPGESLRDAALRAAQASTHLRMLALVASLGSQVISLPDMQAQMTTDALLQLAPESDSTVIRSTILRRGLPVRLLEDEGAFVRVLYEETALREGAPVVTGRQTGWVLREAVTNKITQHFFHLLAGDTTADDWRVVGDGEQVITCRWQPLSGHIALTPPYDAWLAACRSALGKA